VDTTQPPLPAIEFGPANAEQATLCEKASHFDWLYMSGMLVATAGAVVVDSQVLQSSSDAGVRVLGPGLVGVAWGWTVGGSYLTLPQCSPDWVNTRGPEGDTRTDPPLALAIGFSLLAAATAPVIVGVETGEGPTTLLWSPGERAARLAVAGVTGAVGSVMPYLLPPRSWRAMKELRRLKVSADTKSASIDFGFAF
jgi:hypothetical protein